MSQFDLVEQNRRLEFPPEGAVRYDFAFWTHTAENVPALGEAALDSNIIALESTGIRAANGLPLRDDAARTIIAERFDFANQLTRGEVSWRERRHAARIARDTGRLAWLLAERLFNTGIRLVPIDIMAPDPENRPEVIEEFFESRPTTVYREGLMLRQLAALGREAARSATVTPVSIMPVTGFIHFPVSIAANRLEADATEMFFSNDAQFAKALFMGAGAEQRGLTAAYIKRYSPPLRLYRGREPYFKNRYEVAVDERERRSVLSRWNRG